MLPTCMRELPGCAALRHWQSGVHVRAGALHASGAHHHSLDQRERLLHTPRAPECARATPCLSAIGRSCCPWGQNARDHTCLNGNTHAPAYTVSRHISLPPLLPKEGRQMRA